MSTLALTARPLRSDPAQLLIPLALLPGLAMAAAHAPVALLTFGPLVAAAWLAAQRDRYLLNHCVVHIDGPALELRFRGRRLAALDLRYASRRTTPMGDVVLSEEPVSYLVFGTDPPDNAYPIDDEGEQAFARWRAVRLGPADLASLSAALGTVQGRPPPGLDSPQALLEALGSVGVWGERAEAQLARLTHDDGVERGGGVTTALRELSLRQDRTGAAARRVLARAQGLGLSRADSAV